MIVTITTVHPSIVIVSSEHGQFELPRASFPAEPKIGQTWNLVLGHEATEDERLADLNDLLPKS